MSTQNQPAHSKIGASSMYRWKVCPASVRLSEGIPSVESEYAKEGTLAHDYAAGILQGLVYHPDEIPAEMLKAISVYIQHIIDENRKHPHAKMFVEKKLTLSQIHPNAFGTADHIMWKPQVRVLKVTDYKHGAGIPVEVHEDGVPNDQLMYYGLGALLETKVKPEIVELTIVQPRCAHISGPIRTIQVDPIDFIDFAADLKMYAERTDDPNAPIVPGEHCRFCPAAPTKCPALRERSIAIAQQEFSSVLSYDPAKLSQALAMIPAVKAWIKATDEFAYAEAMQGRTPPGFKLVEKRATRSWSNEEEVTHIGNTVDPRNFFETKLKSVTQVEKALGKKEFEVMLGKFVTKESSGTVLVPEDDKRPAYKNDPTKDFVKIATTPNELFE